MIEVEVSCALVRRAVVPEAGCPINITGGGLSQWRSDIS
jgi:hypothetical protein